VRRAGALEWWSFGFDYSNTPIIYHSITPIRMMIRRVEPELLDDLLANDPRAIRSRRDLRRVNAMMGNAGVIARAVLQAYGRRPPRQLVDLGAGDGTFMLRLAKRLSSAWPNMEVTLVDRQDIVSAETRREFEALSWSVRSVAADVFDWLARSQDPRVDLVTANLFLHHFAEPALRRLMGLVSGRTDCFAACEPRRYPAALRASRWLWLLGCNQVTRHDAVASVRAGFDGPELSALWPGNGRWRLREEAVGLFSHRFVAQHG
jgi:2-polyprenyl-3-methyl-5-hydroxy-6-metoxy-1,4-benzoquinol methylase